MTKKENKESIKLLVEKLKDPQHRQLKINNRNKKKRRNNAKS